MTYVKYTTVECDICHEAFPAETIWVDKRRRKKQKLLCYGCRAVEFVKSLKHTQGRQWMGVPFNLLDWQENEILRPFFGTVDEHGIRQYRFVYVEVPKKSGKTELAGAVGNYCLYADGELGGEIYSAAGDKEQASKTFNAAMEMVVQNTSLKRRTDIIRSRKRMVVPGTNSFFAALSRETFTKHGYNPSCVVIDELHAHRDREMYDVLVEGTDTAREQQVIFIITTAGIYDKTSIGWEVHDYALKVKNGIIDDPTFLPLIYAADEKDDWRDEKTWRKVNPSIDSIVPIEKLRDHYNQVKNIPARENNFRRFRLNQWVAQLVRWMPMAEWDSCGEKRLNPETLYGRRCYGGLDLASTTDIAAFNLVFPPEDDNDKEYKTLSYFWIPEDNIIERGRKDHVPYDMWIRAGLIEATPGNVIDYKWIIAALDEITNMFDLQEVAFDRWGATKIIQDLEDLGFTTASSDADVEDVPTPRLIQFGQGFKSMSPPSKELLNLVLLKRLVHGGNPVLRWMADNIVVRMNPAGWIKPDKEKSIEKIDGMVALIMALSRALLGVVGGSSYDDMTKEEIMEAMLL